MPEFTAMERIRGTTTAWLRTLYPPADLGQYRADLRAVLDDLTPPTETACPCGFRRLKATDPEPPVGSRITNHDGHSWERATEGHWVETGNCDVKSHSGPLTWAQVVAAANV